MPNRKTHTANGVTPTVATHGGTTIRGRTAGSTMRIPRHLIGHMQNTSTGKSLAIQTWTAGFTEQHERTVKDD
jgi:hypothetical protein